MALKGADLPLDGINVVSFGHFLLGPAASQYLADLGATVTRVEPVGGGLDRTVMGGGPGPDGAGPLYLSANRNTRSIALDLNAQAGASIAKRLALQADVLVENFRPGVLARFGLDYESLVPRNPRLVYASASGYGSGGPLAGEPGQDLLIQSVSGLAWAGAGEHRAPTPAGAAVVDQHSASLLALGVASALVKRERTGEGSLVEINMLDGALDLQQEALGFYLNGRAQGGFKDLVERPDELATWYHPGAYGLYRANDGNFVAISLVSPSLLESVFDVHSDEPSTRSLTQRDLVSLIRSEVGARDSVEVLSMLKEKGVWATKALTYDEVQNHPQVIANASIVDVAAQYGDLRMVAHPLHFGGMKPSIRSAPPSIGEHTKVVLKELGFDKSEIENVLSQGAAASSEGGD